MFVCLFGLSVPLFLSSFIVWLFSFVYLCVTLQHQSFARLQSTQRSLEDFVTAANEKGNLVLLLDSCEDSKDQVELELRALNLRLCEVQTALREKEDEMNERSATVASLGSEFVQVSEKVKELTTSTEDLRVLTLETDRVEEQRENYEVRTPNRNIHLGRAQGRVPQSPVRLIGQD